MATKFAPRLCSEIPVPETTTPEPKPTLYGVDRFELPNLGALNFLLHGALDGGGTLSLKTDAQGKVFSTAMLRMTLDVPVSEASAAGLPGASRGPDFTRSYKE